MLEPTEAFIHPSRDRFNVAAEHQTELEYVFAEMRHSELEEREPVDHVLTAKYANPAKDESLAHILPRTAYERASK